MHNITNISPIDGRYHAVTKELYFLSEFGLIQARVQIEIKWLLSLLNNNKLALPLISQSAIHDLNGIINNFNLEDALKIKEIENTTNHDVKAVEYFIKQNFVNKELATISEYVHFACTSEDINNLAYALMLKQTQTCLNSYMSKIYQNVKDNAHRYAHIPMLSRTHGQAATPTTVGKEFANVAYRMNRQIKQLEDLVILGKINGATGNYNAHMVSFPEVDWVKHAQSFVESLGIMFNPYTTQIEPHDYIAEMFAILERFNNILIDFDRDIWNYISLGFFKQKPAEGEVGSSTMPHKINPIDFENSEGNLGVANAILNHLANKLPISRMQRDLSDSTVLRNIGVGIAHSLIAYKSTLKGLSKLEINELALYEDLNNNWEVLAEPIQTIMRRYSVHNPYERLKSFTRGKKLSKEDLHAFINTLELPQAVKEEMLKLTPHNYIGYAEQLAIQL